MKTCFFRNALIGFAIGLAMAIPGVSGGTLAVILGIYAPLIGALADVFKTPLKSFSLLGSVALGVFGGMTIAARIISLLSDVCFIQLSWFFIGTISGGVVVLAVAERRAFHPVWCMAGMLAVVLTRFLPKGIFESGAGLVSSFGVTLLAGLMTAVAVILPGVSLSLMMVIIGNYDRVMHAIAHFDLLYLAPLGFCTAFWAIALGRGFSFLLRRYPGRVNSVLLGFAAASVGQMYPGLPGTNEAALCAFLAALGFVFSWGAFFLLKKKQNF